MRQDDLPEMGGGNRSTSPTAGDKPPKSYIHLPLVGSKQAPPKFKGHHRDLERFLERFQHVCEEYHVTEDAHMCRGILQYCSSSVAEVVENFDGYKNGDFEELRQDFMWFFDGGKKRSEYHLGYLEEFTRAWREEEIANLDMFKQYQREFIRIAGALKTAEQLEEKAYCKWFWVGFHPRTRKELEVKILNDDPGFDIRQPFPIPQVVKAAKHIFSRNRFDKDLLEEERRPPHYSRKDRNFTRRGRRTKDDDDEDDDTDEDIPSLMKPSRAMERARTAAPPKRDSSRHRNRERSPPRRIRHYPKDDPTDDEVDLDEDHVPTWKPPRRTEKVRLAPPQKKEAPRNDPVKDKSAKDDIADIVQGLERLRISEPEYRSLYARLFYLSPQSCRWYPEPAVPNTQTYSAQRPRLDPADRTRRDPPPHIPVFPDVRSTDRPRMTCYGCGDRSHRMGECDKIEALVVQGKVRRIAGRLKWLDGSSIYREPDETWVDAIRRRALHEEKAKVNEKDTREKGVFYMDIGREDSDADTEDQEDLGWRSGIAPVNNVQASGVDRPPQISRDARRSAQPHLPTGPHRMPEFPSRRSLESQTWKRNPIADKTNVDRGQQRPRTPTIPTPVDVTPKEVKDERGGELIPMDVDEPLANKSPDNRRKGPAHERKENFRNIPNVRTGKDIIQSKIVDEVLNCQLTITVQELVSLCPSWRQDLLRSLRAIRVVEPEDADAIQIEGRKVAWKADEKGKEVLRVETRVGDEGGVWMEGLQETDQEHEKRRRKLITLKGSIGRLQISGIVDSGASANIISVSAMEATGLPIVLLQGKAFPVTGITGPSIKCRYWIPNVTIYLTDGKLPTKTDLFVVEGVKTNLLYGRPWMVDNLGGIQERKTGTYVSWHSNGVPYELNTTKAAEWEDENGEGVDLYEAKEDTLRAVTAMVVRRGKSPNTDLSYVPDSEEARLAPTIESPPQESDDSEEARQAEEWARKRIAEWKRGWEVEEEAKAQDVEITPPPPNQLGRRKAQESPEEVSRTSRKRRKVAKQGKGIIEVDEETIEEFTQLVQEEVDEEEWEAFCAREKSRRAKKDKHWLAWIEKEGSSTKASPHTSSPSPDDRSDPEGPNEPEAERQDPPEPSQTLRTPLRKSPEPAKEEKDPPTASASTEVVARRSQRVRWLTEKGSYGEQMKNQRRTYRRKDMATRTISKKIPPDQSDREPQIDKDDPQIFCFCLQLGDDEEEVELSSRKGRLPSQSGVTEMEDASQDPRTYESPAERVQPVQTLSQNQSCDAGGPSGTYGSTSRDCARTGEAGQERDMSGPRPPSLEPPEASPEEVRGEITNASSGEDKHEHVNALDKDLSIEETTYGVVSPCDDEGERETTPIIVSSPPETPPSSSTGPSESSGSDSSLREIQLNGLQSPNLAAINISRSESPVVTTSEFGTDGQSLSINEPNVDPLGDLDPRPFSVDSEDDLPTLSSAQTPSTEELSGDPDIDLVATEPERPEQPALRRMRVYPNLRTVSANINGTRLALPRSGSHELTTDSVDETDPEEGQRPEDGQPMETFQGDDSEPVTSENCCRKVTWKGQGSVPIKTRRKRKQNSYLSRWLPSPLRAVKRVRSTCKTLTLLLLLLILVLVSQPPQPTNHPTTHQFMIINDPAPDGGRLSNSLRPPMNPYQSHGLPPTDPPGRTNRPDAPDTDNDAAKKALDVLQPPSIRHMIPALFAVRHLVPLIAQSSLPTHEFLGKATTVSIRLPNGRMVHHRADVHVRLFVRDTGLGWDDVLTPSRTELDHLQGILFREKGYQGVMDRLRHDHRGIRSFSVTPEEGDEIRSRYEDRKGVTPDGEEEEMGRAPPNTPNRPIKIGPPKKYPFRSQLPEDPREEDEDDEEGELLEDTDEVRVKEEEDDDALLAEFLHVDIAKTKKSPPSDLASTPASTGPRSVTLAPPNLGYPDAEHNRRADSAQKDGKHTIVNDKTPTTHQDQPGPPPVAPTAQPTPTEARASNEVLAEVILCLLRLKNELATALDRETSSLVEEVERDARNLLKRKGEKSESESRRKDKDGDIKMGEDEDPVPAYRSSFSPPDPRICRTLASRLGEAEHSVKVLRGEVKALKWRKVDDDSTLEGRLDMVEARMDLLEGKLAAREIQRADDEPVPITARRCLARESCELQDRPITRGVSQRLEARMEELGKDVYFAKANIQELERAQVENGIARRRMNEAEKRIVGVEGELAKGSKRLAEAEARIGEIGLRNEMTVREFTQEKHVINSGLLPRVSKLESQLLNVVYRLATAEEQMGYTDQKIRTLWLIGSSQNPAEAYVQTINLRNIWVTSSAAYQRRLAGTPSPLSSNNPFIHGAATNNANTPGKRDEKPTADPPGSAAKPSAL